MSAKEWIATDRAACQADVAQMGLDDAADYQMALIAERMADGDQRWVGITRHEMREALRDLVVEVVRDATLRDLEDGDGRVAVLLPPEAD